MDQEKKEKGKKIRKVPEIYGEGCFRCFEGECATTQPFVRFHENEDLINHLRIIHGITDPNELTNKEKHFHELTFGKTEEDTVEKPYTCTEGDCKDSPKSFEFKVQLQIHRALSHKPTQHDSDTTKSAEGRQD